MLTAVNSQSALLFPILVNYSFSISNLPDSNCQSKKFPISNGSDKMIQSLPFGHPLNHSIVYMVTLSVKRCLHLCRNSKTLLFMAL